MTLMSAATPASPGTPARGCAPVLVGSGPALHPEGIAVDPVRGRFLGGSVTADTVSLVAPAVAAPTRVDHPSLVSTMGIAVDALRRRLVVTNIDLGRGDRTSPDTRLKIAGVGIYDLRTGAALHRVDLAALTPDAQHAVNDVTLGP